MDANKVEELEKKMSIEIMVVRAIIQDRFSGVDQKLATIEQLLRNIIDDRMWGPRVDRFSTGCSNGGWPKYGPDFGIERNLCRPVWVSQRESGFGNRNGPRFGFDDMPHEWFGQKVVNTDDTKIVITGQDEAENDNEIVKTGQDETKNDTEIVKTGQDETENDAEVVKTGQDVTENDTEIVRTGQDETKKDTKIVRTGQDATKIVKTGQDETVKYSSGSMGEVADKTDVSLEDSLKADQRANNDSCSRAKSVDKTNDSPQIEITAKSGSVESEKGDNKLQAQLTTHGSNEKGHEASEKPRSLGLKNHIGCDKKRKRRINRQKIREKKQRKRLNLPVVGPNDGPRLSCPFTATKQLLDMFTSDEREILTDIEPVMQSIQRIMHQNGYNDGDPLSADDQTYILDNVFNYHPEKAQKMGAGLDYIMVSKHMKFQDYRCFYIVLNGHKEEFCYEKCLENFIRGKYPDKVDKFMPKYFKKPQPCPPESRAHRDSVPDETGTHGSQSGSNRETSVATTFMSGLNKLGGAHVSGWDVAGSVYFVKPAAHK